MDIAPDLIDEMLYNEEAARSPFAITPSRLQLVKDFSTALAIFINLTLIITYERVNNYRDVYRDPMAIKILNTAGIIQGCVSAILILFYVISRGGLITKSRWREFASENAKTMEPFENEDRYDVTEMSIKMTHTILMTKGPEAPEFEVEGGLRFGNFFTRLEYNMYNILFIIEDTKFLY